MNLNNKSIKSDECKVSQNKIEDLQIALNKFIKEKNNLYILRNSRETLNKIDLDNES